MNKLHPLNKKETDYILKSIKEQFGISKVEGIFMKRGAERIFFYQGSLTAKQIHEIEWNRIPIERAGIYFGKEQNDMIRLSMDAIHLFKEQITKNIFELNKEQLQEWMYGSELNIKTGKNTFLVMKYKEDFVGTGKASAEKITNFIPKNRRLKFKE